MKNFKAVSVLILCLFSGNCCRFSWVFVFVFLVDIVSAIEIDKAGDYLAVGYRGGRVILFDIVGGKNAAVSHLNRIFILFELFLSLNSRHLIFRHKTSAFREMSWRNKWSLPPQAILNIDTKLNFRVMSLRCVLMFIYMVNMFTSVCANFKGVFHRKFNCIIH